jgi:site-specific recombinase XerD
MEHLMTETLATRLPTAMTTRADSDAMLIARWLHGRPESTRRAYTADTQRFLTFVGRPLRAVVLDDVQDYAASLNDLAPATRARRLNTVKSLLTFGFEVGYLPFNVGKAVKPPPIKNVLAERILPEAAVYTMLSLEPTPRNRALLKLLYAGGLRVSEVCGLRWRDLVEREGGGQVNVFRKGGKSRVVLLPATVWAELLRLRDDQAAPDAPVFRSRKGGPLDESQVRRIVAKAGRRAGIARAVSPHWLRHAHASHALDRGAKGHVVQQTLGHSSLGTTSKYAHARPSDSSSLYLAV